MVSFILFFSWTIRADLKSLCISGGFWVQLIQPYCKYAIQNFISEACSVFCFLLFTSGSLLISPLDFFLPTSIPLKYFPSWFCTFSFFVSSSSTLSQIQLSQPTPQLLSISTTSRSTFLSFHHNHFHENPSGQCLSTPRP